ncbi:MAG: putative peptidoglycan glycosyltransferase FtsW [Rectinemataceae bacterium]|nr:putative peptidoglycan glycosyltransferase FtsW [Rectinemataceae bacterium]
MMRVRKFRHGLTPAAGPEKKESTLASFLSKKEKPYVYKSPYTTTIPRKREPGILPDIASLRAPDGEGVMLFLFACLTVMGFAVLWSGSSGYALSIGRSAEHFLIRQLLVLIPACALFAITAVIPFDLMRPRAGIFMIAGLLFLILPLLPGLGESINGASRWIRIGPMTVQPSEFWKPILVFYLAHILDKKRETMEDEIGTLIPPFLVLIAGCGIIFLQSNFSTSAIVAIAGISVFWAAGAPFRFFVGIISIVLPLGLLSVLISDYRMLRVLSFVVPGLDPHGQGYQVQNSLKAIISGGWFGKGIGLGTRKVASIPAVQSDFIFASFVEETGLVGVIIFFAIWGSFFFLAFRAAFRLDGFRSYLAFGLTCLVCVQVMANVAVVSGFVPATGLPLPLFSAGGSSMFMIAICFGLLYNCTRTGGYSRG